LKKKKKKSGIEKERPAQVGGFPGGVSYWQPMIRGQTLTSLVHVRGGKGEKKKAFPQKKKAPVSKKTGEKTTGSERERGCEVCPLKSAKLVQPTG